MIVMKFGGSSVGSPAAIRRVASIVESQAKRQPAVVVSAIGSTTDQLIAVLRHARLGQSYLAWNLIKELREEHFAIAEELLGPKQMKAVDPVLRETFRDLHVRMAEICEGERVLTPEETDRTLSIGEQISSLIVAATFQQLGIPCSHLDSRKLIVTDNIFNNATPRYWETYARLRWSVPRAARDGVVVLGGFMGATEQGQTTTLGRGGSDLTATIVGAALNAEEIQIWKDVDGILTADPRTKPDALLVKNLCYQEAAELAHAGAKVLHPETIAPAQRLRIPILLRNTFKADAEGSSITFRSPETSAKSIVCKSGITVLEISGQCSQTLNSLLAATKHKAQPLGMSNNVLYLALEGNSEQTDLLTQASGCFEAHIRTEQAIITVIGAAASPDAKIAEILRRFEGLQLPRVCSKSALRMAVPQRHLAECFTALYDLLFAAPDPVVFAKCAAAKLTRADKQPLAQTKDRQSRLKQALALVGGNWNPKSA